MAQAKIIDHFAVAIQSTDGEIVQFKSSKLPVVASGFLAICEGNEFRHFNLSQINAWMYKIVDKE